MRYVIRHTDGCMDTTSFSAPIGRLLGFETVQIGPDCTIIAMNAGPEHANPMGTLHGGVLCDLSDAAMGMEWLRGLHADETFTTVELKINFFRPVWTSRLLARAVVVRRGRQIGYLECEVKDDAGKLVAKAASTCMTLRGGSGTRS